MKLLDINFEEIASMNFGKYKKAKYILMIDSAVKYSFVTTRMSEEEAKKSLIEVMKYKYNVGNRYFKIIKKDINGEKILLQSNIELHL